ncbi:MAG: DUF4112 domain-containing protein [Cyanobacteriota bacterium]|nr:DUF4112 domain-containing protein [Cyanobacteriota bacterium]
MIQSKTRQEQKLEQLRSMSYLLDSAIPIPGTRYRIGLDPILGLLPAVGDYLGAIFSGYIVVKAARMGASKEVLSRMTGNIILEAFVGTIPLVGDLFDAGWKANVKNIELLETHLDLQPPQSRQRTEWVFLGLLLGGLTLAVLLFAALSISILTALFRLLGFQ